MQEKRERGENIIEKKNLREKKKKNVIGIKLINVIINVLGVKVIITAHICSGV